MLPHLLEKEVAPSVVLDGSSPRTTGTLKIEELSWAQAGGGKGAQLPSWRLAGIYVGLTNKAQGLSLLLMAHLGVPDRDLPLCPSSFLPD